MSRARRLAYACPLAVALVCALAAPSPSSAALSDVPTPTVSDPIANTGGSHPFLAADPAQLAQFGYVEREYYVTGDAFTYTGTSGLVDATKVTTGGPGGDGKFPYKTRIVVRRPANPEKFNGTTLLEWYNVTAQFDIEWNWFNDPEYLMRRGYAFVGVSAQRAGVNALKAWNPARYGDLNVNKDPATADSDVMSFDIFGAVAKAVKGQGNGRDPMNGLETERVIANGESQSGGRMNSYYNTIQPLHEAMDGFLITVAGGTLRSDRPQDKAIRVLSENETKNGPATDPDGDHYRRWEVAGGSHLPYKAFGNFAPIIARDLPGTPATADCALRPLSRVQWPYVANRAIDALVRWKRDGTVPPTAPRATYSAPNTLQRDADGNALGGIRLPLMDVPVATATGSNTPLNATGFSPFCGLLGSWTKFSLATLAAKYDDYGDYVDAVAPKAQQVATDGFLLQEDVEQLNADARAFTRLRPTAPAIDGGTPVSGDFDLAWRGPDAAATATSYELEHRSSAAGADWESVDADIDDTTYAVDDEDEGTFSYRLRGNTTVPALYPDPEFVETTPWSDTLGPVKVDRTGPTVTATPDRAPDAAGWFKDTVTVTFAASDPALPDDSTGVGVDAATVAAPATRAESGTFTLSDAASDTAGNTGAAGSTTVNVDADPPSLAVECPTGVFVYDDVQATIAASDAESGLTADPTATPAIDTATTGTRTVTATATDAVGHTVTRSCSVVVRPLPPLGATGPQGPTGVTGATGAQGVIGPQGLPGGQGVAGPAGPAGATGTAGVAGSKGDKGERGETGRAGRDARVTCRSTGTRRVRCTVTTATASTAKVRLSRAGRTAARGQRRGSGALTLKSARRLKGRYTLSVTVGGTVVERRSISL